MTADTEQRLTEAQEGMDRTAAEMEERVERLDDHIGEAKKEVQRAKEDPATPTAAAPTAVAGDWEDTDDDSGGDDASAFDDPESEEEDDEEDEDEK